jgi:hypothetical protein
MVHGTYFVLQFRGGFSPTPSPKPRTYFTDYFLNDWTTLFRLRIFLYQISISKIGTGFGGGF